MKKFDSRKKILLIFLLVLALIILGINIKLGIDKKNAEKSQIDVSLIENLPYDTDMAGVCEWLDQNGFTYEVKHNRIENVPTPNGWTLSIQENLGKADGLYIALIRFDKLNYNIIYERTKTQLEELLGPHGIRFGGLHQWLLEGNYELYVNYHTESGQININIGPLEN